MRYPIVALSVALLYAHPALALYDDKPAAELSAAAGEWRGTLTYEDYQEPGKLVTLPTQVFVALGAPDELVLQYVYDDGPGKTVYSYERMRFDLARKKVRWASGAKKKSESTYQITANTEEAGLRRIVFERRVKSGSERFTLELGAKAFTLKKEELSKAEPPKVRNTYALQRVGA
ncbi:MAG: hypothetical protein KC933_03540 [Myxococcales bacterium]|nr:hypothetical protein [Myxococcales bacterium]